MICDDAKLSYATRDLLAELKEALALMTALAPFVVHGNPLTDNEEHPELYAVFRMTYAHACKVGGEIVDAIVAAAEEK